ncbi:MAG: Holliday junction branch migration protein RuvA [Patescibacteria group bacterium]
MISYLRGQVKIKSDKYIILDVAGVGYQIFVSPNTLKEIGDKEEIELYTHLYLREDGQELYGFLNPEEKEFFELLLSVSGVGPKGALGVLAIASLTAVKQAIIHGDPAVLTKVSGIGKKTAERIIVELKNKIDILPGEDQTVYLSEVGDSAAIDALVGLGYSASEARDALKEVDKEIPEVEERVRAALKLLGKK